MNAFQLELRLIDFANGVLDLAETIPDTYSGKHLASQIIRSSTSPAMNYGEAQGAESREDFIHKMKICQKELRETYVILKLIEKRRWVAPDDLASLLTENNELISIFVASTKTAIAKKGKSK